MSDNIQLVKKVSEIEVHTYGRSYGNSNPKVSIFWNGKWTSWQTVNIPRRSMPGPLASGWAKNSWTLEGDQFDANNLRVQYKAQCTGWIWSPFGTIPIGSNTIDAFYCNITYEPAETTTTLIGSTERYFKAEDPSSLGFTVLSMEDFSLHANQAPRIDLSIEETQSYNGNVDIKIKIDKEEIWSIDLNMNGIEEFNNIDAWELVTPYIGTHQVIVEVSNGAGPDNIYKLNYIKIHNLHCQQNRKNVSADLMFAPVTTFIYGEEKDDSIVAINTQVPYNDEDGITSDYRHPFTTSIVFYIDPGYNGPDEEHDTNPSDWSMRTAILYLQAASLHFKVIYPDGSYVECSRYSLPFGILPSVSHEVAYVEIIDILEYLNLFFNLLPLPDYIDLGLDFLDVYLVFLPESTPSGTDDGRIEPDTAYASWETGYDEYQAPDPKFDEKFSLRVNWIVDLPLTNPPVGSYQVEITFSLEIYLYEVVETYLVVYPVGGYWITSVNNIYKFTLSETSYVNFIYEP